MWLYVVVAASYLTYLTCSNVALTFLYLEGSDAPVPRNTTSKSSSFLLWQTNKLSTFPPSTLMALSDSSLFPPQDEGNASERLCIVLLLPSFEVNGACFTPEQWLITAKCWSLPVFLMISMVSVIISSTSSTVGISLVSYPSSFRGLKWNFSKLLPVDVLIGKALVSRHLKIRERNSVLVWFLSLFLPLY